MAQVIKYKMKYWERKKTFFCWYHFGQNIVSAAAPPTAPTPALLFWYDATKWLFPLDGDDLYADGPTDGDTFI